MGRINMDSNINEDTLQEVSEAAALLTLTGWPYTNAVGNCWCGHSTVYHALTEDKPNCIECQCVGFALDTWATDQGE